ncbi:MAG: hypothetical protein ABIJ16_02690 [Bacteroidota bacterium]
MVIFIFLVSCDIKLGGKLDQGIVEYEITYLEDDKQNPIISLLPTTMEFKFKDNNYSQKVEGWMGIFSMAGLCNKDKNEYSALLKIMSDRYVYQGKAAFGYDEFSGMKIEFTKETKVIAGFTCKEANIVFPNKEYEDFKIYYTEEIELENPNFFNPFKEIPGVILEYQYEMFDITTKLIAIRVEKIEITDDEFEVPADYKKVEKEEMEEVINNLM